VIGLDTNVLVRFLVQDDPEQSAVANELFETRLTAAEPGFVSIVALAEAAWVLERSYRFPADRVAAAIERMVQAKTLVVQHEREVVAAATIGKEGGGSFSDAPIGALGLEAGCRATLTFDRRAARLPWFLPIRPGYRE